MALLTLGAMPSGADPPDDPRVADAMVELTWVPATSPEYAGCSTVIPSSRTEVDTVHVGGYTLLAENTGDTWRTKIISVHSPKGDAILTWKSWMSDVHVLIDGNVLYRTDYIAVASGLSLSAHDLTSGEILWETKEHGYWDISHLSYNNWGAWICLEEGRLVLIGREANGGYVETVDPKNGEVLERTYLSLEKVNAIDARNGIENRTGLPIRNNR